MRLFTRRRVLVLFGAALIGLAALVIWHRPVFQWMAAAWVVDEPPAPAAAIVVLGGSVETRPFAAAKLFKEGVAPRILLPRVKPGPAVALGLKRGDTELARELLLHEGVPDSAIELIGHDVSSTFEETEAVKEWLKARPAGSPEKVIIPTETFFTRRTRWIFRRTLGDSPPVIVAIPTRSYTADDWWKHEEGLIDFQNEVIKLIYYHIKY